MDLAQILINEKELNVGYNSILFPSIYFRSSLQVCILDHFKLINSRYFALTFT